MNRQFLKLVIVLTVLISAFILLGYWIAGTDAAKNIDSLSVSDVKIECLENHSEVHFRLQNVSANRVDFARVVITISDKTTGENKSYEVKYRNGILANEVLEKNMIIDRFDCSKVEVTGKVYTF